MGPTRSESLPETRRTAPAGKTPARPEPPAPRSECAPPRVWATHTPPLKPPPCAHPTPCTGHQRDCADTCSAAYADHDRAAAAAPARLHTPLSFAVAEARAAGSRGWPRHMLHPPCSRRGAPAQYPSARWPAPPQCPAERAPASQAGAGACSAPAERPHSWVRGSTTRLP